MIAPVFEGFGTEGGVPGDVNLIRVVLHHPPASDTTLLFPIAPGQDSITIQIPVLLSTSLDTIAVTFQALSDSTVLYSGTQKVAVRVGPPAPATPVVALYVGPGRNIRTITVTPRSVTLRPGDSVALHWSGTDSAGRYMPQDSIPAWFKSLGSGVASVGAGGVAHAVGVGTAQVVITSLANAGVRDTATVTVSTTAPPIASIAITPGFAVLRTGDTASLATAAFDANGNPLTPTGVSFVSRTPAVATVSATGLVTGVAAGTAVIVASAGAGLDSMLVAVAANGSAVASAVAGGRMFASNKVGDTVRVRVVVDTRAVAAQKVGSYNAMLVWNAAALRYVSSGAVTGGFAAPTVNETLTSTGQLRFGSADPNGATGQVALIEVRLVGAAAGLSSLTLTLTDLSAAGTFANLLPAALLVSGSVTVH